MANTPAHIVSVLRVLRDSHQALAIEVFGSAARGSMLANDVDIAIDLRGLTAPVTSMGARYDALNLHSELHRQYGWLLTLAAKHYGRFDPFLITDRGLFGRNAQANNWVKALKASDLLRAISSTSKPLARVLDIYGVKSKVSEYPGPMADPLFQRWFGQSKAVDELTGAPLVLFHGTGADVGEVFRPGTFFTRIADIADIYAKAATRQTDDAGPNIAPVFLSVQNPFIFDDAIIKNTICRHIMGTRTKLDAVWRKLSADGFDGFFHKNRLDLGGIQDQYVIFKSSQVKSAVGWQCAPRPAQVDEQLDLLADEADFDERQAVAETETCRG